MKKSNVKKEYDAVEMMRKIRDELGEKYRDNPTIEDNELEEIRRKYKIAVTISR